MPSRPDISVVVACFDEEPALPRLFDEIAKLDGLLARRGLVAEHVLVDDGSRDRTAELIGTWCAAGERRRLVAHRVNRGFGAAMRTGFAEARGAILVSYDADATYPVEDVLVLFDSLAGADVATASPFAEGGSSTATPFRELLSRAVAGLYRIALRRSGGLATYTCAFRAYRREVVRDVTWRADGFLAAAEVAVRLLLSGVRIREVPSTLSARRHGASKMRVARTALSHLSLIVRVALRAGDFRPPPRGSRGPPPPPVAEPPAEDLAGWNARLNRDWPMRAIDRHRNPIVRAIEGRRRREVLRLSAAGRGQRVLDVGAEEGAYARALVDRGARPLPLDIDPAVLGRGRDAHGLASVAGDAGRLPFADRSVPRVLLAEVLEHCPRPADALAEALRVVTASGRVALSVPDDHLIIYIKRLVRLTGLSRLLGGLPPDLAPGHLHVFRRDALRELLTSSGRLVRLTRDFGALAFLAVVAPRPEEA